VRRIAILIALVATTTLLAAGVALTQTPEEDTDPYIVVLEESVDSPSGVAEGIEGRQENLEVDDVYTETLEGFSAEIPDDSLDEVRNNSSVAYVERDKKVTTTAQTLPWGIDRINADLSSTRAGDGTGEVSGVHVYVIDTGIAYGPNAHPDLDVVNHVNMTDRGPNRDCDGHGTHVAGTLAARDNTSFVVGVAPRAPLTGVKVLDCNGEGWDSDVIDGIEWVTEHAQKPAVANMSLGGSKSRALNTAVRNSAASGVFYSLSAGNKRMNACKASPAMTGAGTNNGIVTTAATTRANREVRWSNFGRCVDLWAPGTEILSTRLGGGTTTMSGTSMAAPHVGGTAALFRSDRPGAGPASVEAKLKADAKLLDHRSKDGRRIRLVKAREY
jgi:subtilisin family serine protease